ncbi:MAG: DNA internalization-related competence protein ComEC/Rec2 [Deltaproteobacteria bacterium]|nr:DNA internalization-related competence protein ComEC/Rec2 [Deltaproteobacteria bacterium]
MSAGYTPKEITERPLFYPLLCLIIGILVWDYWIQPAKTGSPFSDRPAQYEGTIVESPRIKQGKIKITVQLEESARPAKVLLTLLGKETLLREGDRIRFTAKLKRPVSFKNPGGFDYAKYLTRQGIAATGFIDTATGIVLTIPHQSVWRKKTDSLKNRTRQLLLTQTSRPTAGILIALLWGDESAIDAGDEKLFRDHGINHLLVISGLHFATIAFLLFGFFLGFGRLFPKLFLILPMRKVAAGMTIVPLTLYFFFCESSPSVTRAFVGVVAYLTAIILGRSRDLLNIVFLAAFIILLVCPSDLFNLSFQLSFGAVLSLVLILPVLEDLSGRSRHPKRAPPSHLKRFVFPVGRGLRGLVLVNIAVFIGLTPVLTFHFHRLSLDGFLMNLWAVPLFELIIVPIGLVALICELFLPVGASFLFSLDTPLVDTALWILNRAQAWFGGPLLVYPPRGWELGLYLFLVLLFVLKVCPRMKITMAIPVIVIFVIDLAARFYTVYWAEPFRITQIDVGQGDGLLVQLPGPRRVLIDGGGSPFFDIGENVLIPFFLHKRIPKLDVVCITHADSDHYLGLKTVLESYRVGELWWNGVAHDEPAYRQLFETAKRKGVKIVELTEGMTLSTGPGDRWEVLSPDADDKASAKDNNRSVVLKLTARGKTALFTGDLESWGEFKLMQRSLKIPPEGGGNILHADYLKVGHHGSRTSSSEEFLQAVSPVVATIGVGEKNRFHHPAREVVRRFADFKIPLYRTDRDGAIEVDFDSAEIQVKTYTKQSESF